MNYLKLLPKTFFFTISLLVTVLGTSASATSINLGGSNLDSVIVKRENLFPEGVEYSSEVESFFVSSLTEGNVYQVNSQGKIAPFTQDERLVSSLGLQVDQQRKRLLVTNSDSGFSIRSTPETQQQLAGLGIYDLLTGESIAYADLGIIAPNRPHLANDVAVDLLGNAYVTDTLAPIIYKVDLQGNASIFLNNERFEGEGFNLNGLVYHPNEFLIVTKSNEGVLFKVPLDNPDAFTQIQVNQTFLSSDGLFLVDQDHLLVVSNGLNQILALKTDNNWDSAQVLDSFPTPAIFPTTATIREEEIFVLYSNLGRLIDPNNSSSVSEYTIQQVGVITKEDRASVPESTWVWSFLILGIELRKLKARRE